MRGSATMQVITTTSRRGAEVFALDLEAALGARGRDVRTVALVPGGDPARRLDVPVLGKRRLGVPTLRRLRKRVRGAGVVIAHGSSTLPACAIAAAGTGTPFVYRNVGDPMFWGSTATRRARTRWLLRRARAVVALTDVSARVLTDRYRVHPDRITVIPTGVDAGRFPLVDAAARAEARDQLGVSATGPVIAYVGALSAEKDVGSAIRAAARIDRSLLLVAGAGAERASLEELAATIAPGRVQFFGQIDDPGTVYAASDVLVLSSVTEGLPGVLIEAGLSGLPAVTTDVGYTRAIVHDGETGVVVAPGDDAALTTGLMTALGEPALGIAARAHCLAEFDMAVIAHRWDRLLDVLAQDDPA